MTAKTFLKQIRNADIRIKEGEEDLQQLDALAARVTSALGSEAVASSKDPDKLTNITAKIINAKRKTRRDVDKYVDIREKAMELLSQVKNPTYYKILHSRYVLYKTLEKIANELGYSYQWVCELEDRALQIFEKILKNNGLLDRN